MVQSWFEFLRNRRADHDKAVRRVQHFAEHELREAMADYDAFVPQARKVTDGLLLGTARSSQKEEIPLRLPWGREYAHWLVQGGTGTGKTTWVASLLDQELRAGRPFGVIDCKGDLFEMVLRQTSALVDSPAGDDLNQRVVVVNPFGDELVPLNICRPIPGSSAEVQAFEITLALSRLFETALGLHMESVLRHLLMLLIESRLSLVEAPQVLEDEVLRGVLAAQSSNPIVKEFFFRTWPLIPQVSKDALGARLQSLLLAENLRLMLGAENLLDLRSVLDRGDPLLVFLGKGSAVPEEQVEILGSLFLQLLLQAAYSLGTGRRRGYLLAVDEFFHLLESPGVGRRFQTALTTARSFGLSLMLIHHNFAQLPSTLREIVLGNCDLVALFRTSGRNAEFFGEFLPQTDPDRLGHRSSETRYGRPDRRQQLETLQRLPDQTLYWYDRRQRYRALQLRTPNFANGAKTAFGPGIATAVPRARLRAEIEARKQRLKEILRPPIRVSPSPKDQEGPGPTPKTRSRRPKLG